MTTSDFHFPHEPLTVINGKPDATSLRKLMKELCANASTVPSDLGGGAHGHLGVVLDQAYYLATFGHDFVPPTRPILPVHTGRGFIAPETLRDERRRYDEALLAFKTYNDVKAELRKQVLTAVAPTYYQILEHDVLGYAGINVLDVLEHLHTTYGTLTAVELEANREKLAEQWNPDQPIEQLWIRIRTICDTAIASKQPITDATVITLTKRALAKS
eukprot:scaffold22595_cov102-Cylindrotheca_fusiformis.AAC.8